MKSQRFDLESGHHTKPSYRKFLVFGACAAVVAFVVGLLIGRYAIAGDDKKEEVYNKL